MGSNKKIFTVDFGQVNLKSLILTNDEKHYENMKAQGNIGVLFEPKVLNDLNLKTEIPIYLIGINATAATAAPNHSSSSIKVYDTHHVALEVFKVLTKNKMPIFAVQEAFELVNEWISTQEIKEQNELEATK